MIEALEGRRLLAGAALDFPSPGVPGIDGLIAKAASAVRAATQTNLGTEGRIGARPRTIASAYVLAGGQPVRQGSVEFRRGQNVLATIAVKDGRAKWPVPVDMLGKFDIRAYYLGAPTLKPSMSAAVRFDIRRDTSIELSASVRTASAGTPMTFTARLTSADGAPPTGKVTFRDVSGEPIAAAPLIDGVARVTLTSLPPGRPEVYATYRGARLFDQAIAAPIKLNVLVSRVIDVLVAYTSAAATGAGGDASIRADIADAIAQTNLAFRNSLINVKLRLVGVTAIDYVESGALETDLIRLGAVGDGALDEIHARRDQLGADLVSLWVNAGDVLGIAGQYVRGVTTAAEGFSVVAASTAAGPDFVFAHEIGHNLGADHDDDNLGPDGPPGYAFGRGHRWTGLGGAPYHDIMAYNPGTAVAYFSNPNSRYQGVPTGVAGHADAARAINLTVPHVAGYRPTRIRGSRVAVGTLEARVLAAGARPLVVTARLRGKLAAVPPTGLITFREGGAILGTAILENGVATLRLARPAKGAHSFRFTYEGDEDHAALVSATVKLIVP